MGGWGYCLLAYNEKITVEILFEGVPKLLWQRLSVGVMPRMRVPEAFAFN